MVNFHQVYIKLNWIYVSLRNSIYLLYFNFIIIKRWNILYKFISIQADPTATTEKWKEVHPRGGKELDVRVVAHSTVYHQATNSLLIYGGVVASVARFSKLSDRMFVFQLDRKVWSEIHYPRAHLRDTYVPRERAFHTCNIIGNNCL